MTTFSSTYPGHHGHHGHHGLGQQVRTKGWSLQPGWRLISHDTTNVFPAPPPLPSSLFGNASHRRSLRDKSLVSSTSSSMPSISDPFSSLRRSSSVRGGISSNINGNGQNSSNGSLVRHVEIRRVGPLRTRLNSGSGSSSSSSSSGKGTEDEDEKCPVHRVPNVSRNEVGGSGHHLNVAPLQPKPRPFYEKSSVVYYAPPPIPTALTTPTPTPLRDIPSGQEIEEPQPQPQQPVSVLKKPGIFGSNRALGRGPKTLKKVAFLENTDCSRGVP